MLSGIYLEFEHKEEFLLEKLIAELIFCAMVILLLYYWRWGVGTSWKFHWENINIELTEPKKTWNRYIFKNFYLQNYFSKMLQKTPIYKNCRKIKLEKQFFIFFAFGISSFLSSVPSKFSMYFTVYRETCVWLNKVNKWKRDKMSKFPNILDLMMWSF